MKPSKNRVPGSLARALSDLVAEGGNVLASDEAAPAGPGVACGPVQPLEVSSVRPWWPRRVQKV